MECLKLNHSNTKSRYFLNYFYNIIIDVVLFEIYVLPIKKNESQYFNITTSSKTVASKYFL